MLIKIKLSVFTRLKKQNVLVFHTSLFTFSFLSTPHSGHSVSTPSVSERIYAELMAVAFILLFFFSVSLGMCIFFFSLIEI